MGARAFSARRALDLAPLRHGWSRALPKTEVKSSFSAAYEAVPFHNCANPRVFPQAARVVPQLGGTSPALSSWAKWRVHALQISCRDHSRPEGPSGWQPPRDDSLREM